MLILTIRTDKPEAEIGLFDDTTQISYDSWLAHRELAETIHARIDTVLKTQNRELQDVQGIVCYEGPGSFTGLRIGLTVANALAYSNHIPIVAVPDNNETLWIGYGVQRLLAGETDTIAMPVYGSPAIVTTPKK